MKISIVTGGDQDHLDLIADTLSDANQIVSVAQSKFFKENPHLITGPYPVSGTVCMKIHLGLVRKQMLDAKTKDALDTTA